MRILTKKDIEINKKNKLVEYDRGGIAGDFMNINTEKIEMMKNRNEKR